MAGFGWSNPFPRRLGGGKPLTQTVYEQLRDSVGVGGWDPREQDSIDGVIRAAQAKGLAAAISHDLSAALQAFVTMATDQLEEFEAVLGLHPSPADEEPDRRQAAAVAWVKIVSAVVPEMEAALQAIDSRFSIVNVDWTKETSTIAGKPFERHDGADAFGATRTSTAYPMYSTEFVLRVLLDIGSGAAPGQADLRIVDLAKQLLRGALPAWMGFSIATEHGFILDTSLLDGAALEDTA